MRPHGVMSAVLLWGFIGTGGVVAASENMSEQSSAAPPFRVAGTVISLPTKIAVVVVFDAQGRSTGEFMLREGDVVEGYRVATIDHDQVFFEQDGQAYRVTMGHEGHAAAPRIMSVVPSPRNTRTPVTLVAPPDDIEKIRTQTDALVRQLKANADFQEGLEALRRHDELRRQESAARR